MLVSSPPPATPLEATATGAPDTTTDPRRLRWRCRRGMRELDDLLVAFVERELERLDPRARMALARLLDEPDPDLHALVTGRRRHADTAVQVLVDRIAGARRG